MGIVLNIGFHAFIFPVIAVNGFHNAAGNFNVHLGILCHKSKKMLLQSILISFVVAELGGEGGVMGIGKGICGIMDQLAQGVIVEQIQRFFFLQTAGDLTHKAAGIVIIMATKPLAADGTFQVCNGVPVRFDTADLKGFDAGFGYVCHVMPGQILSEAAVAFSAHLVAPFQ